MADGDLTQSANCYICTQAFPPTSLFYGCADGHFICKKCYKEEHIATPNNLICLYNRCQSTLFQIDNRSGEPSVKLLENRAKMFPEPLKIAKEMFKEATLKRSKTLLQGSRSNCSIGSLSKKPLNCPYTGCEKTIAVAAVGYHFKIEHKCVTCVNSCFGKRLTLQIHPYAIKYNQKLCILLIKIDGDGSNCSRCFLQQEAKDDAGIKPAMIVLGSRISNYQLASEFIDSDDSNEDYDEDCFTPPTLDKIILWIACNIPTKCKYTMAVSTLCETVRLKYYGYVAQICDDYQKLCHQGRGLILNYSHIVGMTNRNNQPVNLDLIIHEEDLF